MRQQLWESHLAVSRVNSEDCLQVGETRVTQMSVSHQLVRCTAGLGVEITTHDEWLVWTTGKLHQPLHRHCQLPQHATYKLHSTALHRLSLHRQLTEFHFPSKTIFRDVPLSWSLSMELKKLNVNKLIYHDKKTHKNTTGFVCWTMSTYKRTRPIVTHITGHTQGILCPMWYRYVWYKSDAFD